MSENKTSDHKNNLGKLPDAYAAFSMNEMIAAAAGLTKPFTVNGVDAVIVPREMNLQTFPEMRKRPQRLSETITCFDDVSFTDYVNTWHATQTLVCIDLDQLRFGAILDYHEAPTVEEFPKPHWGEHRVCFTPQKTPEWDMWMSSDGKWQSQDDFAEFVEVNGEDIVKPEAARLFEIVTQFKATKGVKFRSAKNLDDGSVNLQYDEDVQASGGNGQSLKVPTELEIGIVPFLGAKAYKIPARFQFRIHENKLSMRYVLRRPHLVWRDAGGKIAENMRKALSGDGIKVINGWVNALS